MKWALGAVLFGCLSLAGCSHPTIWSGAREIEPPRKGIYVGGLYYSAGAAKATGSKPVNLVDVCSVSPTLEEFGVKAPEPFETAEVDILVSRKFAPTIKALNIKLAELGLSGTISDYYEYKITNVIFYSIPATAARKVYTALMRNPECRSEFEILAHDNAVFQVQGAYVGDVVFNRRADINLSPTLAVKLNAFTPVIQATFQREYQAVFRGKGLIFAFIPRVKTSSSS